ncbi:MAG: GNAT family N-acetyltransferase [Clostridia bacterium]|nr:GNAT family N-acetyltransferase [Clostridia bacterium]
MRILIEVNMYLYFETERLAVRQYTINDVDELLKIMSDARVHTYTKDKHHPWDKQRTEEYIQFMINKNFKTLDCFHGAVIEKAANQLIGLCGLNPYQVNEPEIEFKIGVPYWGKGYATELGKHMIKAAFATTDIKGIYGMAQQENLASRKVLEKIGMHYLGNQIFRNHEDSFYYIANTKLSSHANVCGT